MLSKKEIRSVLKTNIHHGIYGIRFAEFSSNLIHFFKTFDVTQWLEDYIEISFQGEMVEDDKERLAIEKVSWLVEKYSSEVMSLVENSSIIYSFHTGSYILIPMLIQALGFDVKILVADNVYKMQADFYFNTSKRINKKFKNNNKVSIISNQEKNIVYKLKNQKSKEKLFIYFDGNVGAGSYKSQSRNYYYQDFFSQELFFHKGTAFLNFFSQSPLLGLALINNKNGKEFELKIFKHDELIIAGNGIKNYCNVLTGEIVRNLEVLVKENYLCWENSLYIHMWLKNNELRNDNFEQGEQAFFKSEFGNKYSFNFYRYFPFKRKNKNYIFDRKTYLTYEVSNKNFIGYVQPFQKLYFK